MKGWWDNVPKPTQSLARHLCAFAGHEGQEDKMVSIGEPYRIYTPQGVAVMEGHFGPQPLWACWLKEAECALAWVESTKE